MITTISDSLIENCETCPDKEALVYKDTSLSYGQFYTSASQMAAVLANNGLQKYDRCAVYMEKRPEEAFGIYGINLAGGIFIDVNHLLKKEQIIHILQDAGAKFLITTSSRFKLVQSALAQAHSLACVILVDGDDIHECNGFRVIIRSDWISCPAEPTRRSPMIETDPAGIIYTSGSTGKPKGVVISQRNLVAGAESVTTYVENTPEDRILSVMPFSFDYGLNQLTSSVHVGCTCVMINYLLMNDVIRAVENHDITGLGLIPPLWIQLLQKQWDAARFAHLRYITNTGGAMPETAVRELRIRLPDTRIYLMFGLTEAFRGTFLAPDLVDKKPASIGKAIPNAEIWILNKDMEHCKPFEPGELVQRGAHVSMGYWNNPEKTAQYFRTNPMIPVELQQKDMVVFSGDTVYMDEDGDIYYKFRNDDMIKSSGYRISPAEVEEILYQHESIKHAAVFGIPEPALGQKICAVVSLKTNHDASDRDILSFCAKTLPNYMMPKTVTIMDELPLNPNGKIDRNTLKKDYGHEK